MRARYTVLLPAAPDQPSAFPPPKPQAQVPPLLREATPE